MPPLLIEQEFKSLQTNVANHEQAIGSLKADVGGLKIARGQGLEINPFSKCLDNLGRSVASTQYDIAELKTSQDKNDLRFKGLTKAIDQLGHGVATLKAEMEALKTANNCLVRDVNELDSKICGVRSDLSGDISVLKTSNNGLVRELADVMAEIRRLGSCCDPSLVTKITIRKAASYCPCCKGHNTTSLHRNNDPIPVLTRWCNTCGDSYEPTAS